MISNIIAEPQPSAANVYSDVGADVDTNVDANVHIAVDDGAQTTAFAAMPQSSDVKLSDQQVFSQLLGEHEKMLRHLITGFEAESAVQDELFQDIALSIWRALPGFRQQASIKTFIARIAHNVLATHVAKAVCTIKTTDLAEHGDSESANATPYQQLNQAQRQQRLTRAIRQLNLAQRQVITLALEGMSYQEIAEILAITTNLVGVRLQRAKTSLTELLEA